MFRALRQRLGVLLVAVVRNRHGVVIFFDDAVRRERLRQIARVRGEVKFLLSDHEALQVMMAVARTAKIKGDIAEVGTYQGGSSKLIAQARGSASEKTIYLFDTFEGLPELSAIDRTHFSDNQYPASEERVRTYLGSFPRVEIYKGIFPESGTPVTQKMFSFVHLDVDLYEATRDSLAFFYLRMSPGVVIISHDYMTAPGVRKAVDEYMADKPEAVFESSWRQCFIVKTK